MGILLNSKRGSCVGGVWRCCSRRRGGTGVLICAGSFARVEGRPALWRTVAGHQLRGTKEAKSLLSQSGSWPFNSPSVCVTVTQEGWWGWGGRGGCTRGHTQVTVTDTHWETHRESLDAEQEVRLELAVCRGSEVRVMRAESRTRFSPSCPGNLIDAN